MKLQEKVEGHSTSLWRLVMRQWAHGQCWRCGRPGLTHPLMNQVPEVSVYLSEHPARQL